MEILLQDQDLKEARQQLINSIITEPPDEDNMVFVEHEGKERLGKHQHIPVAPIRTKREAPIFPTLNRARILKHWE